MNALWFGLKPLLDVGEIHVAFWASQWWELSTFLCILQFPGEKSKDTFRFQTSTECPNMF